MPLYEYKCLSCGKENEQLIRSDEKPVCPDCGSLELKKKISLFAAPKQAGYSESPCGSGCAGKGCPSSTCGFNH